MACRLRTEKWNRACDRTEGTGHAALESRAIGVWTIYLSDGHEMAHRRAAFPGSRLVKVCWKSPDSFGAPISNRLRIHEKAQGTMARWDRGYLKPSATRRSGHFYNRLYPQALRGWKAPRTGSLERLPGKAALQAARGSLLRGGPAYRVDENPSDFRLIIIVIGLVTGCEVEHLSVADIPAQSHPGAFG
jgi:hypothetical protein